MGTSWCWILADVVALTLDSTLEGMGPGQWTLLMSSEPPARGLSMMWGPQILVNFMQLYLNIGSVGQIVPNIELHWFL
jgi:hypothetical protein